MKELNKIYNEDCLIGMKDIPDHSIDCIICDLPYGTTACSWDEIIPFDKLWEQYDRIIKPNGVVVLFAQQPFSSLLVCSNLSNFKEEIIWEKNKGGSGLMANQRHIKIHENILVFSNKPNYTYNPIKWYVDSDKIVRRKKYEFEERNNIINSTVIHNKKVDDGSRFPISILTYNVPYSPKNNSKTKNGDYRMHPTQKPVELIEYLVKTYSNEGDIILDNCMGSGTTAIAAMNTNRNFIGFEIEKKYFDIANRRILENTCEKLF